MFLKYQLKFIGQWEEHTVNANELADMAENACCAYQKEIAAMLRQQQAEIDTYKSQNNNQIDTYRYKELTDEEIEQVRVAIMGAAYWCADENMPEAYNAVKVCCAQVLGILVKAQEK
jgi:hypothetical protein